MPITFSGNYPPQRRSPVSRSRQINKQSVSPLRVSSSSPRHSGIGIKKLAGALLLASAGVDAPKLGGNMATSSSHKTLTAKNPFVHQAVPGAPPYYGPSYPSNYSLDNDFTECLKPGHFDASSALSTIHNLLSRDAKELGNGIEPASSVIEKTGYPPGWTYQTGKIEGYSKWPAGTTIHTSGSQQYPLVITYDHSKGSADLPYIFALDKQLDHGAKSLSEAHAKAADAKVPSAYGQKHQPLSTSDFPLQRQLVPQWSWKSWTMEPTEKIIPNVTPNLMDKSDDQSLMHTLIVVGKHLTKDGRGDAVKKMLNKHYPFIPPQQSHWLNNPTLQELHDKIRDINIDIRHQTINRKKDPTFYANLQAHGLATDKSPTVRGQEGAMTGWLQLAENDSPLWDLHLKELFGEFLRSTRILADVNACSSGAILNVETWEELAPQVESGIVHFPSGFVDEVVKPQPQCPWPEALKKD